MNSGVCFIKGKETLLNTLGASSWFSTEIQVEKGYTVGKNGLIISHMWIYFSLIVFCKVPKMFLSFISSRMAYGLVLK